MGAAITLPRGKRAAAARRTFWKNCMILTVEERTRRKRWREVKDEEVE